MVQNKASIFAQAALTVKNEHFRKAYSQYKQLENGIMTGDRSSFGVLPFLPKGILVKEEAYQPVLEEGMFCFL